MTDTPDLPEGAAKDKVLPPDAIRALEEAAERRRAAEEAAQKAETDPEWRLGTQGNRLRFLVFGEATGKQNPVGPCLAHDCRNCISAMSGS